MRNRGNEFLWAPITFTRAALSEDASNGGSRYSSDEWRDWWCCDDAAVYQFIGQDNIFFYCIVQNPLWDALDWGLITDTPVANYHILFMNKKASSSGAIKPPMFIEAEITETDPGFKGDTVQGGTKPATIETGATLQVPMYLNQGERIKVDTRDGKFVSRV